MSKFDVFNLDFAKSEKSDFLLIDAHLGKNELYEVFEGLTKVFPEIQGCADFYFLGPYNNLYFSELIITKTEEAMYLSELGFLSPISEENDIFLEKNLLNLGEAHVNVHDDLTHLYSSFFKFLKEKEDHLLNNDFEKVERALFNDYEKKLETKFDNNSGKSVFEGEKSYQRNIDKNNVFVWRNIFKRDNLASEMFKSVTTPSFLENLAQTEWGLFEKMLPFLPLNNQVNFLKDLSKVPDRDFRKKIVLEDFSINVYESLLNPSFLSEDAKEGLSHFKKQYHDVWNNIKLKKYFS